VKFLDGSFILELNPNRFSVFRTTLFETLAAVFVDAYCYIELVALMLGRRKLSCP